MNTKESRRLITRYLSNSISPEELKELQLWLEDTENQEIFKEYVKTDVASIYHLKDFDEQQHSKNILQNIKEAKKVDNRRLLQNMIKYAAAVVILVGTTYSLKDSLFSFNERKDEIILKNDAITLELENGETEVLNTSTSKPLKNSQGLIIGKQDKNNISYSDAAGVQKLSYNTLNVPKGKKVYLELSDGTKVHINAGSTLKYPVKFLSGMDREVFLTGEAFFDVQEDKNHPFKVNAQALEVTVLGTEFVVSLYPEDRATSVVLVEGAVVLSKEKQADTIHLKPGQKGVLNSNGQITQQEVNTKHYTSWIDDILIFRGQSFNNIAKKIERVYNVEIIINNKTFGNEIFNASFHQETIDNVLGYFKDSHEMNYRVENNIIYIN